MKLSGLGDKFRIEGSKGLMKPGQECYAAEHNREE